MTSNSHQKRYFEIALTFPPYKTQTVPPPIVCVHEFLAYAENGEICLNRNICRSCESDRNSNIKTNTMEFC